MLYVPDVNKPFILDTDASKDAIAAVLQQEDEGHNLRVVAYASKILKK